jgi:hypothetical protein
MRGPSSQVTSLERTGRGRRLGLTRSPRLSFRHHNGRRTYMESSIRSQHEKANKNNHFDKFVKMVDIAAGKTGSFRPSKFAHRNLDFC